MCKAKEKGFTLVELLVVIVVIAILAAITIVAYNGIANQARASSVQSDLKSLKKQILLYQVDNSGFPTGLSVLNNGAGAKAGSTSYVYHVSTTTTTNDTFCLTGTNGTTTYFVTNLSTPNVGACPGDGIGGMPPITNLSTNPGAAAGTSGFTTYSGSGNTVSTGTSSVAWSQSKKAFRVTWGTVGSTEGDVGISMTQLSPNTTYTVSYKLATSKNTSVTVPGIYASSGSYSIIGKSTAGTQSTTAGIPISRWVTFKGDATSLSAGLRIVQTLNNKVSGDWIEVSDVIIVEGTTPQNYADGSSPGWIWNGGANASTSQGPAL